MYKIIGSLQNLEIAEVCARSGSNCGSLFLDLRFRELVRFLMLFFVYFLTLIVPETPGTHPPC